MRSPARSSAAAEIIDADQGVDERFRAILRQLVTFMMEDPRSITSALDTVWAAKAIERVGDHAKNIAEHVITSRKAPTCGTRRPRKCAAWSRAVEAASGNR